MPNEPEAYQPEVLVEEEPRYLRRQKPVEIRRRKLGRPSWQLYKRVLMGTAAILFAGFALYRGWRFFYYSPQVALLSPRQVELVGNHYVGRDSVIEKFLADRDRSVLRVPLEERRRALEAIPWVEQASVERILPNRIRVELVERTPVAFVRLGTQLALVDGHGVILERPAEGVFQFPVVAGLGEALPTAEREARMQLYAEFLKEIELVRPGATNHVSEVDVADKHDLHALLVGFPELAGDAGGPETVLVHFGDNDFANKYRMFVESIGQWRAAAGRVDSVDLRFARQVVVNPEAKTRAARAAPETGSSARAR